MVNDIEGKGCVGLVVRFVRIHKICVFFVVTRCGFL
jgi:hypothetical protein